MSIAVCEHIIDAFEKAEAGHFGVLSTGETLAVAMILDRRDLLAGYTMLEAVERLGPEWTRCARIVQQTFDSARLERVSKTLVREHV